METQTDSRTVEPAQDTGRVAISQLGSKSNLRAYVLLAVTAAGLLVCGLLVFPFLSAVTWAIAFAVLFTPAHRLVERHLKSATVAALFSVGWIGLLIVLPGTFLVGRLISELPNSVAAVNEMVASKDWRSVADGYPVLAVLADWSERVDLPGAIGNVATWLATASGALVRGGILQLITLLLMLYFLFYFLRDRDLMLGWLREISPLSRAEMDRLFARIDDTVRATLYGTVVVASIQGTLGGLIFWCLGLPMPLLWGLVMGLLSVIPTLGAFLIWIPAAVFLAVDGSWGKALILTAWGAIAIGGIDNVLYPMLVGNRLKLHSVAAFLSIVGGIVLFGIAGIILGPLTITLTVFLLEIWRVDVRSPSAQLTEPPRRNSVA